MEDFLAVTTDAGERVGVPLDTVVEYLVEEMGEDRDVVEEMAQAFDPELIDLAASIDWADVAEDAVVLDPETAATPEEAWDAGAMEFVTIDESAVTDADVSADDSTGIRKKKQRCGGGIGAPWPER